MKMLTLLLSFALASALTVSAFAQEPKAETVPPGALKPHAKPTPAEKAQGKAQRKAAGAEAARDGTPAEGNPIPGPTAKVSKADRQAATAERKAFGAQAARDGTPAEGNPIPEPTAKVSKSDRQAANAERKAETRRVNRAGEITSKGETGLPQ